MKIPILLLLIVFATAATVVKNGKQVRIVLKRGYRNVINFGCGGRDPRTNKIGLLQNLPSNFGFNYGFDGVPSFMNRSRSSVFGTVPNKPFNANMNVTYSPFKGLSLKGGHQIYILEAGAPPPGGQIGELALFFQQIFSPVTYTFTLGNVQVLLPVLSSFPSKATLANPAAAISSRNTAPVKSPGGNGNSYSTTTVRPSVPVSQPVFNAQKPTTYNYGLPNQQAIGARATGYNQPYRQATLPTTSSMGTYPTQNLPTQTSQNSRGMNQNTYRPTNQQSSQPVNRPVSQPVFSQQSTIQQGSLNQPASRQQSINQPVNQPSIQQSRIQQQSINQPVNQQINQQQTQIRQQSINQPVIQPTFQQQPAIQQQTVVRQQSANQPINQQQSIANQPFINQANGNNGGGSQGTNTGMNGNSFNGAVSQGTLGAANGFQSGSAGSGFSNGASQSGSLLGTGSTLNSNTIGDFGSSGVDGNSFGNFGSSTSSGNFGDDLLSSLLRSNGASQLGNIGNNTVTYKTGNYSKSSSNSSTYKTDDQSSSSSDSFTTVTVGKPGAISSGGSGWPNFSDFGKKFEVEGDDIVPPDGCEAGDC
jgi:hypothetical protein